MAFVSRKRWVNEAISKVGAAGADLGAVGDAGAEVDALAAVFALPDAEPVVALEPLEADASPPFPEDVPPDLTDVPLLELAEPPNPGDAALLDAVPLEPDEAPATFPFPDPAADPD